MGGVSGRGCGDGGDFVRECEEDDVLDGAAVAGTAEWAAYWCRVTHLADGGDVTKVLGHKYPRRLIVKSS